MKKSSSPTERYLGDGVFLQHEFDEEKKKQRYNKGKKYFYWSIATTTLLLKECLDKEVWSITYGNTEKVWMEVCTVLRTYPNQAETFSALTWRKCKDEYDRNVKLYKADKQSVPFQSGTDKEHQEWEDVMEEIFQQSADRDVQLQDSLKSRDVDCYDSKALQKDLQYTGEMVRDDELVKFTKKKQHTQPNSKNKQAKAVKLHQNDSDSSVKELQMSATDKLALALVNRLEADTKTDTDVFKTQADVPRSLQEKQNIHDFKDNRDLIEAAGIGNPTDVDRYLASLQEHGFETPLLLLGLQGSFDFMIGAMQFKHGHAIRLMAFLERFNVDV